VLEAFIKRYNQWRRNTLPPPVADIQWRHETVIRRLDQLELSISNRFPHTVATSSQQREILAVLRLLEPKKAVGVEKKRVGSPADGGYVQLGDLDGVGHAFSFGVSDDDSWDLAMAQAGVPVEQFDHSIERAPSDHPLLRFHRKMIAVEARNGTATLPDLVAAYSQSAEPDLVLKIDIEGAEWDVFDSASEDVLSKFTQIICEFHELSRLTEPDFRARARRVFGKLATLFAPVHVHGNNCCPLGNVANVPLPDALEITFASRRRYDFADSNEVFPTPLDSPNSDKVPDIVLGSFRF
jgi:FkbM family methyltransferase